jgi:hypothetical protein
MRKQIFTVSAVVLLCAAACTSTENTPAVDDAKLPALPHDIHSHAQAQTASFSTCAI